MHCLSGEANFQPGNLERPNGKVSDDSLPKPAAGKTDAKEPVRSDVNGTEQPIPTARTSEKAAPAPPKPMQRSEVKRPTSLGNY